MDSYSVDQVIQQLQSHGGKLNVLHDYGVTYLLVTCWSGAECTESIKYEARTEISIMKMKKVLTKVLLNILL